MCITNEKGVNANDGKSNPRGSSLAKIELYINEVFKKTWNGYVPYESVFKIEKDGITTQLTRKFNLDNNYNPTTLKKTGFIDIKSVDGVKMVKWISKTSPDRNDAITLHEYVSVNKIQKSRDKKKFVEVVSETIVEESFTSPEAVLIVVDKIVNPTINTEGLTPDQKTDLIIELLSNLNNNISKMFELNLQVFDMTKSRIG